MVKNWIGHHSLTTPFPHQHDERRTVKNLHISVLVGFHTRVVPDKAQKVRNDSWRQRSSGVELVPRGGVGPRLGRIMVPSINFGPKLQTVSAVPCRIHTEHLFFPKTQHLGNHVVLDIEHSVAVLFSTVTVNEQLRRIWSEQHTQQQSEK